MLDIIQDQGYYFGNLIRIEIYDRNTISLIEYKDKISTWVDKVENIITLDNEETISYTEIGILNYGSLNRDFLLALKELVC